MNYRYGLILILAITAFSCTVYQQYPVDVFRPGAVDLPKTAEHVAVTYRNFKYPGDTLLHYYSRDFKLFRAKNDPKNLDSLLAMTCLNAFAGTLKKKTGVDKVSIIPYNVFRQHTGEKLPKLDPVVVDKLTSSTEADVLVSLETFSSFYSSYPDGYETVPADEVITVAVWGVYDPDGNRMLDHKSMIDTIVWHAYDEEGNYQPNYKAPPRIEALRIASAMAGEAYSKRFYASWETEMREYSIPPVTDFSIAASYFEDRKYDEAITIWKRYANKRNGKMAIHARYNLALAYEIKDNPQLSMKWLNAARELAVGHRNSEELSKIDNYRKILSRRIRDLNQLNQE